MIICMYVRMYVCRHVCVHNHAYTPNSRQISNIRHRKLVSYTTYGKPCAKAHVSNNITSRHNEACQAMAWFHVTAWHTTAYQSYHVTAGKEVAIVGSRSTTSTAIVLIDGWLRSSSKTSRCTTWAARKPFGMSMNCNILDPTPLTPNPSSLNYKWPER